MAGHSLLRGAATLGGTDHRKRWRIWATRTQHGCALCGHCRMACQTTTRGAGCGHARTAVQCDAGLEDWISSTVGLDAHPRGQRKAQNPSIRSPGRPLGHAGFQDFKGDLHDCAETVDQDSGRLKTRRYRVMGASVYSPYVVVEPTLAEADLQGQVRVVSAPRAGPPSLTATALSTLHPTPRPGGPPSRGKRHKLPALGTGWDFPER